ncbi:MAG TPA: cupin domain-containing protein [Sphingomicrobium sp.]|nr:cupin domain-containing protein [Sphingomicrobium sp.]
MPKLDLESIEQTNGTGYPPPYDKPVAGRWYRRLAPAGGLTDIGASHCVLEPGAWSSQRHWHEGIDEFVVMLEGEAVLIEDDGETVLRAGDCAAFPKDVANGHHLVNRSERRCAFLAFDSRYGEGDCHYPDADLRYDAGHDRYTRKNGTPY